MTRFERKQAELEKLYEYKRAATVRNDLWALEKTMAKIDALEKEIIEMHKEEHATVFSVLRDKDKCVKHGIYKALIRISLMADATNEACEEARELLAQHGVVSFSFANKIKELCRLSQEIASVTLNSNNKVLEDFIVNNDKFVEMCMKHADAYLKKKMKL